MFISDWLAVKILFQDNSNNSCQQLNIIVQGTVLQIAGDHHNKTLLLHAMLLAISLP